VKESSSTGNLFDFTTLVLGRVEHDCIFKLLAEGLFFLFFNFL
jgi:hypothetical protein